MNGEYRSQYQGRATAACALGVVIATLVGGYLVVRAVNVQSPANAWSMLLLTRERAERSVARVLEKELSEARLKALLGGSTSTTPDAQTALANIAKAAGTTAGTPGTTGASPETSAAHVVSTIESRGADLAHRIAALIRIEPVNNLRLQPTASSAIESDVANAIEKEVANAIDETALNDLVKTWAEETVTDASVRTAWSALNTRLSLMDFASGKIHLLRAQIAKRLAADLFVGTWHNDEVERQARDLSKRLTWATAAVLFIGLWCAAVMIALWQTWTLLPQPHATVAVIMSVLIAIALGAWAVGFEAIQADRFELLGPVLSRLEIATNTHVMSIARVFNGMAAAAITLLLTAAAATTWNDTAGEVEAQLEGLRSVFNAGAALLVAGALEVSALYGWPASTFEATASSSNPLDSVSLYVAGVVGALFSVALMVVYLPAASILRLRARKADPAGAAALLQAQGFNDSALQQLLRVLQALTPLIAIPLAGLTSLLDK